MLTLLFYLHIIYRTFGAFTMETIVAIAFGRVIDIQRGENDELTNAANVMFRGAEEGNKTSLAVLLPLLSKLIVFYAFIYQSI